MGRPADSEYVRPLTEQWSHVTITPLLTFESTGSAGQPRSIDDAGTPAAELDDPTLLEVAQNSIDGRPRRRSHHRQLFLADPDPAVAVVDDAQLAEVHQLTSHPLHSGCEEQLNELSR